MYSKVAFPYSSKPTNQSTSVLWEISSSIYRSPGEEDGKKGEEKKGSSSVSKMKIASSPLINPRCPSIGFFFKEETTKVILDKKGHVKPFLSVNIYIYI